jgi:hypothetical protein
MLDFMLPPFLSGGCQQIAGRNAPDELPVGVHFVVFLCVLFSLLSIYLLAPPTREPYTSLISAQDECPWCSKIRTSRMVEAW